MAEAEILVCLSAAEKGRVLAGRVTAGRVRKTFTSLETSSCLGPPLPSPSPSRAVLEQSWFYFLPSPITMAPLATQPLSFGAFKAPFVTKLQEQSWIEMPALPLSGSVTSNRPFNPGVGKHFLYRTGEEIF